MLEWWHILLIVIGSVLLLFLLSIVFYKQFFKRFWDIVLSLFALIVLSPLLIIISIIARIKMGKDILFKQKRIGKNNKEFKLLKYRTMTNDRDENGVFLPDDQRVTKFGNFLRKTSIDELPSLINILKGDMSIIGPRPLPVRYLPRYNEEQRHRHDVRPGLTGYAQCHGRNSVSWKEKFEMDVWYTKHISLFGDIGILFKTVFSVFKKEGINSETSATMEEFMGNDE